MEHEDTKIRSFSFSWNHLPFFVSSCLVKIIPTYFYTITKGTNMWASRLPQGILPRLARNTPLHGKEYSIAWQGILPCLANSPFQLPWQPLSALLTAPVSYPNSPSQTPWQPLFARLRSVNDKRRAASIDMNAALNDSTFNNQYSTFSRWLNG